VGRLSLRTLAAGTALSALAAGCTDHNTADNFGGVSNAGASFGSVGTAPCSSGALTTITFSGHQYLFVAARSSGLVRIDITDAHAQNPEILTFPEIYTTTFKHVELGGIVPVLGHQGPQVFVHSYGLTPGAEGNTTHWALVSAETGHVDAEGDIRFNNPIVRFSGGSALISGGISDPQANGIWLATADGYGFFDLSVNQITRNAAIHGATNANPPLAENLGGNPDKHLLFAANADDSGSSFAGPLGPIQIINTQDLSSKVITAGSYNSSLQSGAGDGPDAGAVDCGYNVGLVTYEDDPYVGLVNLNTLVNDGGSNPSTFEPGGNGAIVRNLNEANGDNFLQISGSAVDPANHLALFMAGFSEDIAVGRVEDPAVENWQGLSNWRFVTLPTSVYNESFDPHAVLAVHNDFDSKSYGYLLSSNCGFGAVVQVDMLAMLETAPDPNVDRVHGLTPCDVAHAITIRDWGNGCPTPNFGCAVAPVH
jgi:hypothetical protein